MKCHFYELQLPGNMNTSNVFHANRLQYMAKRVKSRSLGNQLRPMAGRSVGGVSKSNRVWTAVVQGRLGMWWRPRCGLSTMPITTSALRIGLSHFTMNIQKLQGYRWLQIWPEAYLNFEGWHVGSDAGGWQGFAGGCQGWVRSFHTFYMLCTLPPAFWMYIISAGSADVDQWG